MFPSWKLFNIFCLGVLIAGLSTPPAAAMCLGGDKFLVSKVEVLSCQAAATQLDKALAEETAKKEIGTGTASAEESEKGRQWLESRAGTLRHKAENVVLIEVHHLGNRVYEKDPRRDPSQQGVWEVSEFTEPVRILLQQSHPANCVGLVGTKIHLVSDQPCCDVIPSHDLACVIHLFKAKLAPPELIGATP